MNSDVSRNYTMAGVGVSVTSAALSKLWAPAAVIGTVLDVGIGVAALSHTSYAENDYDVSVLYEHTTQDGQIHRETQSISQRNGELSIRTRSLECNAN